VTQSRRSASGGPDGASLIHGEPGGATALGADSRVELPRTERSRPHVGRLRSLDAARGLAIVIMLLAGNPFPREHIWVQLTHPEWHGLRFADLFFPLFLFAMGVSMTLSRRSRSPRLVLRRAVLLLALGVLLSSMKHETLFITGVLQHIAGAYLVAWLVLTAPRRLQPAIAAGIMGAVWAGFEIWAGGESAWSRRETVAHAVDGWLLGGFSTEGVLQTITSSVTVVGGSLIGRGMQRHRDPKEQSSFVGRHAVWLIAVALLISLVVPINKRLWTPSFTVLTLGTSCAWLAILARLERLPGSRSLLTPLQELGGNPIVIYVVFMAARALLDDYRGLWPVFALFGSETAGTLLYGLLWVGLAWFLAHQLFRRRIFVKI
jgi:predicted acyltransferase